MFFSSMSDLLYGTMNLIVPIAVKYFETFCISQKSKSIEIIIVRNSVIMFDLSVKKKKIWRVYKNAMCNVYHVSLIPCGEILPL